MANRHPYAPPLARENIRYDAQSGRYRLVQTIEDRRLHRLAGAALILGSAALVALMITGAFIHG